MSNGIPHISIKLSFKLVIQNHSEVGPLLNSTRKGKLGGMQKSEHKGPSDDSDKQTQPEEWAVEEKERKNVIDFCWYDCSFTMGVK